MDDPQREPSQDVMFGFVVGYGTSLVSYGMSCVFVVMMMCDGRRK